MAQIVLENVSKSFGNVKAVKNFSLEINDKEFLVLVGPSGCGKSTTLRIIAGLEEPDSGKVFIGDQMVNHLPPKDRNISMVFQDYALFPHLSVYDNIGFGMKIRKFPKHEIEKRVKEAAAILGIGELLDRKPKELSGGQRQRVAVGRAIVRNPSVFLFDEPLSNLDAKLRVQMRGELSRLHDRLKTTMIYVTHDQVEAMTMGTKIVIMREGVIEQVGPPMELYDRPTHQFVAGFIGSPAMNFVPASITLKNSSLYIDAKSFQLLIPPHKAKYLKNHVGQEITFGIRAEDLQNKPFSPDNVKGTSIEATIEVIEPLGSEIHLEVSAGEHLLVARVEPRAKLKLHQTLKLYVNMDMIHVFEKLPPYSRIKTED
ncbi:MAG: ABC transporter ATP-binding protein [Deltaproteobacteria bacterium]|nr:ABC transporter ATP-binding protein [Deltaproteobacteria bacterium]